MKTRIYVIGEGQNISYVRALTRLQALDYVTKGKINIKAITKAGMEEAMRNNVEIKDATGGQQKEIA